MSKEATRNDPKQHEQTSKVASTQPGPVKADNPIVDKSATASDTALPQNPKVQEALAKLGQPPAAPRTPADIRKEGEPMVTMIIPPKGIKLILDGGVKVNIPGGTQNIPQSLAEHWYVKAHGAKRHAAAK